MMHIVQRSKYITLFRSEFQFLSNPLQHTCRILTVYRHRCFQTCRNMVIISIIIIIKLRIGERRRSLHSFRTAFSCQYQRPIEQRALLRNVNRRWSAPDGQPQLSVRLLPLRGKPFPVSKLSLFLSTGQRKG